MRLPARDRALRQGAIGLALVALLGVAGCSGDDTGPSLSDPSSSSVPSSAGSSTATTEATEASSSATVEAAPSLPVPAGVELTEPGSQLTVGETATVAYQPNQKEVGVLDIKVTRIEKTSISKSLVGWDLDEQQQKANPYFVRATVTNRGDSDLGGRRVPLYVVDGTNALVESTSFASSFTACQPGSFPDAYPTGTKVKVCMVYLAPGKGELTAVSFRPAQEYDPITWTGPLQKVKPPKSAKAESDS